MPRTFGCDHENIKIFTRHYLAEMNVKTMRESQRCALLDVVVNMISGAHQVPAT